jgi:hypothetical protein
MTQGEPRSERAWFVSAWFVSEGTNSKSTNPVVDFYRCPETLIAALSSPPHVEPGPGYFQFGTNALGYGSSVFRCPPTIRGHRLPDLSAYAKRDGSALRLPFEPSGILRNLRYERYPLEDDFLRHWLAKDFARRAYYRIRSALPVPIRRILQRAFFSNRDRLPFPHWPVDTTVENIVETLLRLSLGDELPDRVPFIWFWPDGATSAATMTHDVEANPGLNFVPRLMDLDDEFGIKASFQLVPEERYVLPKNLLPAIRSRGFEINVHGLNHDGNLFADRKSFLRGAALIKRYARDFGAEGFRSTCMYRNVDWFEELGIRYDMSVPNVAHLEPQRGGCCTVFPYFIGDVVELPLTTIQDYSLFHILGEYSIGLWKKQIQLILEKNGLISFVTHPDYLCDERALPVYRSLLEYLSGLRAERRVWVARPGEIQRWWRARDQMQLVLEEGKWRIIGSGSEQARIAFASIEDGRIVYQVVES